MKFQAAEEKISSLNELIADQKNKIERLDSNFRKELTRTETSLKAELNDLQMRSTDAKNQDLSIINDLQRESSLLKQELTFRKSEIEKLKEQVEFEKSLKLKFEDKVETLREQLEQSKKVDDSEIIVSKMTYMDMEQTIHKNLEHIRNLERSLGEERIECQISLSKYQTLQQQFEEHKRTHQDLVSSLNERLKSDEINRYHLEQFKNLSQNEMRDKVVKFEAQILKLKNFKIILKYATTLQCANCNRFISTAMFVDHLKVCLPHS